MIENKPIALMTGLPGSGKTALIVKFIKEATEQGRPVFQMGIPELKLPHFPTPPIEDWTELRPDPDHPGLMLPYFTFPEKSLVVLSEAQRVYRPRPNGSKLPDYVAAFETVRHTGVTFIFDTQHPDFLDSHVRKLVGQHIHLLDHGVLGRYHYEWPYCGTPEQFKSAPIKKKYKLPKEIFGLYKSASLHIKRKYTIPPALILLVSCILLIGAGFYYLWGSISKKVTPQTAPVAHSEAKTIQPSQTVISGAQTDPAELLVEFNPRVPGRPETAPAYDQLRQVKNMPVVVGCIQTKNSCGCQNQQGLDAGLDRMQCQNWLKRPPFDPYRDAPQPVKAEQRGGAATQEPTHPDVLPPPAPQQAVLGNPSNG